MLLHLHGPRAVADEHLVHEDSERPHVGGERDVVRLGEGLGRPVDPRALHPLRRALLHLRREPKVDELELAVAREE